MKKKPIHKKVSNISNIEISQELNSLLKKYNIDKVEYVKPFSVEKYYNPDYVIEGKKNIKNLICPICYNILKNPISCNSTKKSHSFCEECINKSLEINDKCPICKQEFESVINKKVEKLLQKLKFKCIYAEEGCPKILDYSIYFKHIDKCGFRDILYECQIDKYNYEEKKYKKCGYVGTIKKLNKHFIKCAFSVYKCIFCNKDVIQANIRQHYDSECEISILNKDEELYIGQHNDKNKAEGYGIYYSKIGIYKGQFHNDEINGYGILKTSEGILMEGEWICPGGNEAVLDGYGIITNELNELEYKGQIKEGSKNGIGIRLLENGYYEGEFKDGNMEGYGIIYFHNHDNYERYEGEFKNNSYGDFGIFYYKDGGKLLLNFKNDLRIGFGLKIDSKCNIIYKGQINDGIYEGYGILINYEKNETYKGEIKNDGLDGYGIYYYSNGDLYEGNWKDNEKNGLGFLYKSNGEKYIQYWIYDELTFEEKL